MILHSFMERMRTNMTEKLVAGNTGIEFMNFVTEETFIELYNYDFKHICM